MRMNRIGGVAALVIALAQCCPALDPTLRFSQYHKTVWHIEQGLPNNHVTAVVHAPGGALLVGTRAGLVSFDGVAFSKFASWDPLSRLSREWITDLLVRRDGTLCVAGRNLGLFALKGSRLELISDQKKIMALFEDSQGALWVASQEAILRLQGGKSQVILREQLHPNAGWQAFAEDSAGVVWIATESGLARYRKGAIEIALPNPTSLGNVMNVWNAGSGIGVGLMRGAATIEIRDGKAVLEGELRTGVPVVSAMRDRDGSTWVSTWGKGVYRQRGAQTDVFDTRSGLPDDFVRDVLQDRGRQPMDRNAQRRTHAPSGLAHYSVRCARGSAGTLRIHGFWSTPPVRSGSEPGAAACFGWMAWGQRKWHCPHPL